MKKLLVLTSLICFCQGIMSQSIFLTIQDMSGNEDIVEFGFNSQATIDLDLNLGEANIYNENFDEGVTIIQRDSFSYYNCGTSTHTGSREYYENNFDSKINYRNLDDFENGNIFEFKINWDNLTSIKFSSDQINLGKEVELILNHDTCGLAIDLVLISTEDIYEIELIGIPQTNFENLKKLKVKFNQSFISNTSNLVRDNHKVFPNPTNQDVQLESNLFGIVGFTIYNSTGQLVKRKMFSQPIHNFVISNIPHDQGIYFLKLEFEDGISATHKIVKH